MKFKPLELSLSGISELGQKSELPPPEFNYMHGTVAYLNRGMLEVNWSAEPGTMTQVLVRDVLTQVVLYNQELSSWFCVISGLRPNRDYQLSLRSVTAEQKEVSDWVECIIRVA